MKTELQVKQKKNLVMTDKEKIRAEIERLYNEVKGSEKESDINTYYKLQYLLNFIDSLQEEPVSEELEEAANDFAEGEWDGLHDNLGNALYDQDYVEYAFKAGAKWVLEKLKHYRL